MTPTAQQLRSRLEESPLLDVGDGFWEVEFRALGSACELFFAAKDRDEAMSFRRAAFDWLAEFEARCSRFLPDSEVSTVNHNAGREWTPIAPQVEMLLDLCDHYHFVTEGAFDATSLPLSLLWDWKRQHDALPSADEIASARAFVGWKRIQRAEGRVFLPMPGMKLDLGGVGKEFAVDCLMQLAIGSGIEHVMVDLGGDIAVHGEPPEGGGWYIGLEDPVNQERAYCGIRLRSGGAIATSGDYRRCFQFEGRTYGHILDCRTGQPVCYGTRAASVIAPRCTAAGVLSTSALIIGGMDAIAMLERMPLVQGCVWRNSRVHETRGFRRSVLPHGWDSEHGLSSNPPSL